MDRLKQIEELGYTVTESFRFGEPDNPNFFIVYRIEGLDISLTVRSDDEEKLALIADPKEHEERVLQENETFQETLERWETEETV